MRTGGKPCRGSQHRAESAKEYPTSLKEECPEAAMLAGAATYAGYTRTTDEQGIRLSQIALALLGDKCM